MINGGKLSTPQLSLENCRLSLSFSWTSQAATGTYDVVSPFPLTIIITLHRFTDSLTPEATLYAAAAVCLDPCWELGGGMNDTSGSGLLEGFLSKSTVVLLRPDWQLKQLCLPVKASASVVSSAGVRWTRVSVSSCCVLLPMVIRRRGLNKLDSSRGLGLARKRQSIAQADGECLLICLLAALAFSCLT